MTNETTQYKRLYKSRTDKMIAGVCGGIAEYFNIDSTVLRLVWVLMIFFGGTGILLYIAAAIVMPRNPSLGVFNAEGTFQKRVPSLSGDRFVGLVLIVVGGFLLIGNLGLFNIFHLFHIGWGIFFSVIFIGVGIALLLRGEPSQFQGANTTCESSTAAEKTQPHRFERSISDRKLFGVCGGLAKYFNIDSTIVRIIFILLTLLSFGLGIIVYVAIAIASPEESIFTKV